MATADDDISDAPSWSIDDAFDATTGEGTVLVGMTADKSAPEEDWGDDFVFDDDSSSQGGAGKLSLGKGSAPPLIRRRSSNKMADLLAAANSRRDSGRSNDGPTEASIIRGLTEILSHLPSPEALKGYLTTNPPTPIPPSSDIPSPPPDLKVVKEATKKATTLAQSTGDKAAEAQAYYTLGMAFLAHTQHAEALKQLEACFTLLADAAAKAAKPQAQSSDQDSPVSPTSPTAGPPLPDPPTQAPPSMNPTSMAILESKARRYAAGAFNAMGDTAHATELLNSALAVVENVPGAHSEALENTYLMAMASSRAGKHLDSLRFLGSYLTDLMADKNIPDQLMDLSGTAPDLSPLKSSWSSFAYGLYHIAFALYRLGKHELAETYIARASPIFSVLPRPSTSMHPPVPTPPSSPPGSLSRATGAGAAKPFSSSSSTVAEVPTMNDVSRLQRIVDECIKDASSKADDMTDDWDEDWEEEFALEEELDSSSVGTTEGSTSNSTRSKTAPQRAKLSLNVFKNAQKQDSGSVPRKWKLLGGMDLNSTVQIVKYPKPSFLYSLTMSNGRRFLSDSAFEAYLSSLVSRHVVMADAADPTKLPAELKSKLKFVKKYSVDWARSYARFIDLMIRHRSHYAAWNALQDYFTHIKVMPKLSSSADEEDRATRSAVFSISIRLLRAAGEVYVGEQGGTFSSMASALTAIEPKFQRGWTLIRAETLAHQAGRRRKTPQNVVMNLAAVYEEAAAATKPPTPAPADSPVIPPTLSDSPTNPDSATATPLLHDFHIQAAALMGIHAHFSGISPLTYSSYVDLATAYAYEADDNDALDDSDEDDDGNSRWGPAELDAGPRTALSQEMKALTTDASARVRALCALYPELPRRSLLRAEAAYMLGWHAYHELDNTALAEQLLFESLYVLGEMSRGDITAPLIVSELGTSALSEYGFLMVEIGKYKYGIQALDGAERNYRLLRKRNVQGFLRKLAEISLAANDWKRSVGYYSTSLRGYKDDRKNNEMVYTADTIADTYANRGEFAVSEAYRAWAGALLAEVHKRDRVTDTRYLANQLALANTYLDSYEYSRAIDLLDSLLSLNLSPASKEEVLAVYADALLKRRWLVEAADAITMLDQLESSRGEDPGTPSSGRAVSSRRKKTQSVNASSDSGSLASLLGKSSINYAAAKSEKLCMLWCRLCHYQGKYAKALYWVERAINTAPASALGNLGVYFYFRGKILQTLCNGTTAIHFPTSLRWSPPAAPGHKKRGGNSSVSNGSGPSGTAESGSTFRGTGDVLQEAVATLRRAYDYFRATGDAIRMGKALTRIAEVNLEHLFPPVAFLKVPYAALATLPGWTPSSLVRERKGLTGGARDATPRKESFVTTESIENPITIALNAACDVCVPALMIQNWLSMAELRWLQGNHPNAMAYWSEARDALFALYVSGPHVVIAEDDGAPVPVVKKLLRHFERLARFLMTQSSEVINANLMVLDVTVGLQSALQRISKAAPPFNLTAPTMGEDASGSVLTSSMFPSAVSHSDAAGGSNNPKKSPRGGAARGHRRTGTLTKMFNRPAAIYAAYPPAGSWKNRVMELVAHLVGSEDGFNPRRLVRDERFFPRVAHKRVWAYMHAMKTTTSRVGRISYSKALERNQDTLRKWLAVMRVDRGTRTQLQTVLGMTPKIPLATSPTGSSLPPSPVSGDGSSPPAVPSPPSSGPSTPPAPSVVSPGGQALAAAKTNPTLSWTFSSESPVSYDSLVSREPMLTRLLYIVYLEDLIMYYVPGTGLLRVHTFGGRYSPLPTVVDDMFKDSTTAAVDSALIDAEGPSTGRASREFVRDVPSLGRSGGRNLASKIGKSPRPRPMSTNVGATSAPNELRYASPMTRRPGSTSLTAGPPLPLPPGLKPSVLNASKGAVEATGQPNMFARRGSLPPEQHAGLRARGPAPPPKGESPSPRTLAGGAFRPPGLKSRSSMDIGGAEIPVGLRGMANVTKGGTLRSSGSTTSGSSFSDGGSASGTSSIGVDGVGGGAKSPTESRPNEMPIHELQASALDQEMLLFLSGFIRGPRSAHLPVSATRELLERMSREVFQITSEVVPPYPLWALPRPAGTSSSTSTKSSGLSSLMSLWGGNRRTSKDLNRVSTEEEEAAVMESLVTDHPVVIVVSQPLQVVPWELFLKTLTLRACSMFQFLDSQPGGPGGRSRPNLVADLNGARSPDAIDQRRRVSVASGQLTAQFYAPSVSEDGRALAHWEGRRQGRLWREVAYSLHHSTTVPASARDSSMFFPFATPLVKYGKKAQTYKTKYKFVTFVEVGEFADASGRTEPGELGRLVDKTALPGNYPVVLATFADLMSPHSELVWLLQERPDVTVMFIPVNQLKEATAHLMKIQESYMKSMLGAKKKSTPSRLPTPYQYLMKAVLELQSLLAIPVAVFNSPPVKL